MRPRREARLSDDVVSVKVELVVVSELMLLPDPALAPRLALLPIEPVLEPPGALAEPDVPVPLPDEPVMPDPVVDDPVVLPVPLLVVPLALGADCVFVLGPGVSFAEAGLLLLPVSPAAPPDIEPEPAPVLPEPLVCA